MRSFFFLRSSFSSSSSLSFSLSFLFSCFIVIFTLFFSLPCFRLFLDRIYVVHFECPALSHANEHTRAGLYKHQTLTSLH
ncbi:hypothetical protein N657DRAFT_224343 [Parathielavia appendiculata]|uniref:Uncharacterized protein n=1 Tax=Parathielavia appendiculata TaxID=2587402 RepID=A0AAN6U768_9PEZI|nr:hypothetical protein N657DRAFT_224343 [Parathielavia appendiculata]